MQKEPIPGLPVGARMKNQNSWLAQSFTPRYPVLNKVILDFDKYSDYPVGPLTVSIRKNLSGKDLASLTVPAENIDYTKNFLITRIHEFNFPDIEVVPGEPYYIVVRAPLATLQEQSPNSVIYWMTYNMGYYSDGKLFTSYDSGKSWLPLEDDPIYINAFPPFTIGADLFFATFGKLK
jgi:hypothetical protein